MAKSKKETDENQSEELPKVQEELFKLHRLKVRSVLVPYVRENKVEWESKDNVSWDMEAQETLFAFWNKMKEDNPTFNIEAKMQKLFVLE